jgi:molybdate transport system substrate-binding protein
MATRGLLDELAAQYRQRRGVPVKVESVGGVDAARRVQAGEAFDFVVLAADAIQRLVGGGHADAGSVTPLVRSAVAVAVRSGATAPEIGSEDALRRAVLAARSIGYSTGPSGVALQQLFERCGIASAIAARTVQAPPGVPVGTLIARGEVELGFQQFSELMHVQGIAVVGPLPAAIQIVTTFSGACCSTSTQAPAVSAWLEFLHSAEAEEAIRRHGMDSA